MTLRDEEPSKMPFSSFSDDHLLLTCSLPLSVASFPSETS